MAKLKPNRSMLVAVGVYIGVIAFANMHYESQEIWLISLLLLGASFIGYTLFFFDKLPDWFMGCYWLLSIGCGLPLHILYGWWQETNFLFTLVLAFMHWAVMLWLLPLYWGIRSVATTFIVGCLLYCFRKEALIWPSVTVLLMLLGLGIVLFTIIIYAKHLLMEHINQNIYFKNQQKLKEAHKIKRLAYSLSLTPPTTHSELAESGTILDKVVTNVTQSITFVDNDTPFYKEDFQSILNKFSEWAYCLKREAKSQDHIFLQPIEIVLEQLMDQLEVTLASVLGYMPRLLIRAQGSIPAKIVGDLNQIIYLLVKAVATIIKENHITDQYVTITLHPTQLQYEQSDSDTAPLTFPAIALIISYETIPLTLKVESYYKESSSDQEAKWPIPLTPAEARAKQMIERIIQAHYGQLAMASKEAMLLVLPCDVEAIRAEMFAKLPMEVGTAQKPITPKEQAASMMELIGFHDFVSGNTFVAPKVIAEILLLLRRCYGFKRHESGQLFYVRAAGIAKLVASWIFHSPKPIYASLLYGLVRYTRLPLSYIKANYNVGIYCFVENILSVDKRQELEQSLLYIRNRFKEAVAKEQFSVLYVKLAERLYDLRHAKHYTNLEVVKQMAKETLTVDIKLAKQYLEAEIAKALETAAKEALAYCKKKE